MDLPRHLIWAAVWTTLWCVLHSLLITHTAHRFVRRLFPRWHVFDRVVYVAFSSLSLALLFAWLRTLPEVMLWEWTGWWVGMRWLGLTEAAVLLWLGLREYDGRAFLGLRQVQAWATGRSPDHAPDHAPDHTSDHTSDQAPDRAPDRIPLRTSGILGIIRHPWYTATLILLVFCTDVTDVNLVWRLVFAVYILVGTELEERKLLRDLGREYADYRRRVPRYFPALSRRQRS